MRTLRWVGLIVLLLIAGKYVLLDTAASADSTYRIDLDALHREAIAQGPLPERIEVEELGHMRFPGTFVVAGDGFALHPMVILSHRVVWPDHSLLIDTGMSPAAIDKLPGGTSDAAAFERVLSAEATAQAIVVTHEHPDHIGGIAALHDGSPALAHVRLTKEQLSSASIERKEFPARRLESFPALDFSAPHSVAPGVVLQKAPGHSTGSQLVYVELQNGARYLFVGDIAWSQDNIRLKRGRPRLAGLLLHEDREAVAAELEALAALPPDIHVVVAHDVAAHERDIVAGLFHKGFTQTR